MKAQATVKNRRRIAIGFTIISVLLIALLFRVAWIQIVDAEELTDKAIAQQTQDTPIEAKRGTIYDRNGKELATSTTCYTLWARPSQIKLKDGKLADIAPTILEVMGLAQPAEMTGESLIVH